MQDGGKVHRIELWAPLAPREWRCRKLHDFPATLFPENRSDYCRCKVSSITALSPRSKVITLWIGA